MVDEVVRLLRERGAAHVDHPGGDLLSHLMRTGARLARWGASRELVLAGQWHAAYGTDGFATALFELDERSLVVDAIGEAAESIVYTYGSCDRGFAYRQIGRGTPVSFRDRFTGAIETLDGQRLHQFAELTVANELDVVAHSETFKRDDGPAVAARFGAWVSLLSAAACADVGELLGAPAAGEP
jgi:hypothetical protein